MPLTLPKFSVSKEKAWLMAAGMVVCALWLSLATTGCAVPQDIKERPEEDSDSEEYEPRLVNPQPSANGVVSIAAACNSYTFRVLLSSLPDISDSRYEGFEVRWFLDYQSKEAPVYFQSDPQEELSFVLNPYEVYSSAETDEEPGWHVHVLEVVVSNMGFEGDSRLVPHYRKPITGAATAQMSWTVNLSGDPTLPFTDEEESEQCP